MKCVWTKLIKNIKKITFTCTSTILESTHLIVTWYLKHSGFHSWENRENNEAGRCMASYSKSPQTMGRSTVAGVPT